MGVLQKCPNQADLECNLSFQKVNQIFNAILETLQLLSYRNPTGFNLSLIHLPKVLQSYFQQVFILFSQPPGLLLEVVARGEEQKGEQEAKGFKNSHPGELDYKLENHSPRQWTLRRPYKRALRPDLSPFPA